MTGADDERLAEIRLAIAKYNFVDEPAAFYATDVFLLRLLDEARAERDQQTTLADQCQTTIAELHAPYWPMSITEKLAELEAELSRLRSPSSAGMVERAYELAREIFRAGFRPATATPNDKTGVLILTEAEFAVHASTFASTVAREAREAAIEECVQAALEYRDEADAGKHPDGGDPSHSLGQGFAANRIAKRLRALSGTAPQRSNPIRNPSPPGRWADQWAGTHQAQSGVSGTEPQAEEDK